MKITREWIQRGVSAGALPPERCTNGLFECPYAEAEPSPAESVQCSLLHQPVNSGLKPHCRPGDWLFEAIRINVIH